MHFSDLDLHYLIFRIHFHGLWIIHSEWQCIIFERGRREREYSTKHLQCLRLYFQIEETETKSKQTKNNNKNENQTLFCSVEARDSYSNVFKIKLDNKQKSSTATYFR